MVLLQQRWHLACNSICFFGHHLVSSLQCEADQICSEASITKMSAACAFLLGD